MKKTFLLTFGMALMILASNLNAQVTLVNIDLRAGGVFGNAADDPVAGTYGAHVTNASAITLNGLSTPLTGRTSNDPLDMQMTYSNLDLDFDGSANDVVTFTVRYEKVDFDGDDLDGGTPGAFSQGFDTGFGNLNDLQVSVIAVSGTTTDSGLPIFFDGFTRATVGSGGNAGGLDRTVEVNGTTLSITSADTGAFQFMSTLTEFAAPTMTISFDNSGNSDFDGLGDGGSGSLVARSYSMQFSLTDPSMTAIKGDVDLSGTVDFADIPAFISVLQGGTFQAEADANCDMTVSFADIPAFIAILQGG